MKVEFLGFQGDRQNHQDWALEIIPETDFEKSFFSALFHSDRLKQMQPIAALLYQKENGISVMVSTENFCESKVVKLQQRIAGLEQGKKVTDDEAKEKQKDN